MQLSQSAGPNRRHAVDGAVLEHHLARRVERHACNGGRLARLERRREANGARLQLLERHGDNDDARQHRRSALGAEDTHNTTVELLHSDDGRVDAHAAPVDAIGERAKRVGNRIADILRMHVGRFGTTVHSRPVLLEGESVGERHDAHRGRAAGVGVTSVEQRNDARRHFEMRQKVAERPRSELIGGELNFAISGLAQRLERMMRFTSVVRQGIETKQTFFYVEKES
jgi:hypothetical protein